jgi:hypothetical protein
VTAITSLSEVTEYPLCWPDGQERAAERMASPFKATMATALAQIENEMRLWRAIDYVISKAPAYRRGSVDPGVALWWSPPSKTVEELRVLACDRYRATEANLRAIGLTLEALRGCDRWGAYTREQAIEGARLALPGPAVAMPSRPWWQVLAVAEGTPLIVVEAAYRALAKERHSDREAMVELNLAVEAARRAKG